MLIQITGETSINTKGLGRIRLSPFCYQEGIAGISANPSDMKKRKPTINNHWLFYKLV